MVCNLFKQKYFSGEIIHDLAQISHFLGNKLNPLDRGFTHEYVQLEIVDINAVFICKSSLLVRLTLHYSFPQDRTFVLCSTDYVEIFIFKTGTETPKFHEPATFFSKSRQLF